MDQSTRWLARLAALSFTALSTSTVRAELFSYATQIANPGDGVTPDELSAALGPPDYVYTIDALNPGVSVNFQFPAPIDDVPGTDLLLYIFVTGQGTESSTVRVEGRAEPNDSFVEVASITTADARTQRPFAGFDHVHAFEVDFADRVRKVAEVRLTNVEGDNLNLDALEAIHPALASPDQAVEMRIFRLRDDDSDRFALRFKNIGSLATGVPLSGFAIEHTQEAWIDQTDKPVVGEDGEFAATPETTAGPDNGPHTQRTEYVWSVANQGLDPGEMAAHVSTFTVDMDIDGDEFLENIVFTLTFLDGDSLTADFGKITEDGEQGQLYSLYPLSTDAPSINGPRPAFFYEFMSAPALAESPCLDCVTDDNSNQNDNVDNANDNNNQNDNADNTNDNVDNSNDNVPRSSGGSPAPRLCAVGLVSPFLLPWFAIPLIHARRRRTRGNNHAACR